MNDKELLEYIKKNGIIMNEIEQQADMSKRNNLLKAHPYDIWQGKDGKWRTYLPDKRKGRVQRVRNTREDIENIIVEYQRSQDSSPTIEEIFNRWNDRRLDLEQISKATYARNQATFKRHFSEFGSRTIISVDEYDWCDFMEEQISKEKLKAKGFAGLKGIIKGIITRAKRDGIISYSSIDVFSEFESFEVNYAKSYKLNEEEVYSEEESKLLVDYLRANQKPANLLILLLFATGIRVGEAIALKHEDIEEDCIIIRRTESRYCIDGKRYFEVKDNPKSEAGMRKVIVPSSCEWLLKKIKLIAPFSEYVFSENDRRMATETVRRYLKKACDAVGINYRSPHKIRKTYVSILLDNNCDKRFVMDQVGHADIGISEQFYHRSRRGREEKQKILDKIAEFG